MAEKPIEATTIELLTGLPYISKSAHLMVLDNTKTGAPLIYIRSRIASPTNDPSSV